MILSTTKERVYVIDHLIFVSLSNVTLQYRLKETRKNSELSQVGVKPITFFFLGPYQYTHKPCFTEKTPL